MARNPIAQLGWIGFSVRESFPVFSCLCYLLYWYPEFFHRPQPTAIDSLLRHCIGDFLSTLQDPDLNVRRVALVAFNSAAHNKPSLVRDLLDTILPQLYNETKVRVSILSYCNNICQYMTVPVRHQVISIFLPLCSQHCVHLQAWFISK